jgi:adenosine deaminase
MVIAEAFLAYPERFDEVYVFTTGHDNVHDLIRPVCDFFSGDYPGVRFSVTATRGINLPGVDEPHAVFEEAMFQWYLSHSQEKDVFACISGGTKTMPATLHQAARFFGAEDIFHVIVDASRESNPGNIEAVESLILASKIKIVSLGTEPGWKHISMGISPLQFSECTRDEFNAVLRWKEKPLKTMVRDHMHAVMHRVKDHATKSDAEELPFSFLRLLSQGSLNWLQDPLNPETDLDWLRMLPKAELHCHFGGFATGGEILDRVRYAAVDQENLKAKRDISLPPGWPLPLEPILLDQYMRLGDNNGSALLKDPGCLDEQVKLLYQHLLGENILYAEIRCSPDNYATAKRGGLEVLQQIQRSFQSEMNLHISSSNRYCHVNLLVIATRRNSGDLSSISRHLALAIASSAAAGVDSVNACRVVGVDLAGYERPETRAGYFMHDFDAIHRCGLSVTAHAGENDDAEGIWQAVFRLNARRLGHALSLGQAPDLLRTVVERRIGVEMCPYANYQVHGYSPMPGCSEIYPLTEYLKEGVMVSVNTDNIGISGASLTENYLLLARMNPGITRMEILTLIRNSLELSFAPVEHKKRLVPIFDERIFQVCLKYGI